MAAVSRLYNSFSIFQFFQADWATVSWRTLLPTLDPNLRYLMLWQALAHGADVLLQLQQLLVIHVVHVLLLWRILSTLFKDLSQNVVFASSKSAAERHILLHSTERCILELLGGYRSQEPFIGGGLFSEPARIHSIRNMLALASSQLRYEPIVGGIFFLFEHSSHQSFAFLLLPPSFIHGLLLVKLSVLLPAKPCLLLYPWLDQTGSFLAPAKSLCSLWPDLINDITWAFFIYAFELMTWVLGLLAAGLASYPGLSQVIAFFFFFWFFVTIENLPAVALPHGSVWLHQDLGYFRISLFYLVNCPIFRDHSLSKWVVIFYIVVFFNCLFGIFVYLRLFPFILGCSLRNIFSILLSQIFKLFQSFIFGHFLFLYFSFLFLIFDFPGFLRICLILIIQCFCDMLFDLYVSSFQQLKLIRAENVFFWAWSFISQSFNQVVDFLLWLQFQKCVFYFIVL